MSDWRVYTFPRLRSEPRRYGTTTATLHFSSGSVYLAWPLYEALGQPDYVDLLVNDRPDQFAIRAAVDPQSEHARRATPLSSGGRGVTIPARRLIEELVGARVGSLRVDARAEDGIVVVTVPDVDLASRRTRSAETTLRAVQDLLRTWFENAAPTQDGGE